MSYAHLRFTDAWPPQELWENLPNWERALDEEGLPGQDETTLRPAATQDQITGDEALTVGFATLASGQRLPALLELDVGQPGGVTVFTDKETFWRVVRLGKPGRWQAYTETWIPPEQRSYASVSLDDASVFPLLVESRLNTAKGRPIRFTIKSTGSETYAG